MFWFQDTLSGGVSFFLARNEQWSGQSHSKGLMQKQLQRDPNHCLLFAIAHHSISRIFHHLIDDFITYATTFFNSLLSFKCIESYTFILDVEHPIVDTVIQ